MSLRTATEKLHGIIEALALIVSFGVWAVYGFPHVMELVVFGCLAGVCIGAYWWMEVKRWK